MNSFQIQNGELAQLARALDLHSRGRGFDSHILHKFLTYTIIDILKIFISQTPVIQFVFVIIDTLQGINWFLPICTSIIINTISKKSKVTIG